MGPEIERGPEARRGSESPPRFASRSEAGAVAVIEAGEKLHHRVIGKAPPVNELAGELGPAVAVPAAGAAGWVVIGGFGKARRDDDLLLAFGLAALPPDPAAHADGTKTLD